MFYSQFNEDRWIENHLKPAKGFFIEVGMGRPKIYSNTAHFEEIGWDGICIEADPDLIADIKKERKDVIECAVSDHNGEAIFYKGKNIGHGTLTRNGNSSDKTYTVKLRTLDSIIKERNIKQIDLLSVDVEGEELNVFKGLKLIKPKVMIVEHTHEKPDKLLRYLLNDYELIHITTANLIFKMV